MSYEKYVLRQFENADYFIAFGGVFYYTKFINFPHRFFTMLSQRESCKFHFDSQNISFQWLVCDKTFSS